MFVDGSVESHLRKHKLAGGSTDSWATEGEIQAASASYGVNISIRIGREDEFYQHTFQLFSGDRMNGIIPYNKTVYLSLRNDSYYVYYWPF